MLGLIFIYFIGKAFYDLAALHKKSKWGFAILGVVSYYVGTVIAGLILGVLSEVYSFSTEGASNIVLGLITLPVGIVACWATYKIIERQWTKLPVSNNDDVLDSDLLKVDD